ncbi:MAG: M949_RS01915 family surface polysaccharide biosynthesis protein [Bacteroidota bacterium]
MRQCLFIFLLLILVSCKNNLKKEDKVMGGIKNYTSVGYDQIPRSLRYKGDFFTAWKWDDQNGENILILSTESNYGGYDESRYLYGTHFARQGSGYEMLWKMTDYEKDCYMDLTCNFLSGSTTVTDLDGDGFAEVKLQYELGCRDARTSASMKLLLYENGKKRALRGLRWISPYENLGKKYPYKLTEMCKDNTPSRDYNGGQYESEKDFQDAPPVFLDFAREEWMKYVEEKSSRY